MQAASGKGQFMAMPICSKQAIFIDNGNLGERIIVEGLWWLAGGTTAQENQSCYDTFREKYFHKCKDNRAAAENR